MSADPLTKAIQKLVALSGGDVRLLRVPRCPGAVQVRTQQIGDARIVVVAPRAGPTRAHLTYQGQVVAEGHGNRVHLRGLATWRQQQWWLFLTGAWAVPLVPQNAAVHAALEQRQDTRVLVSGVLDDTGLHAEQVSAL